jgi:hypothetical protein
LVKNGLPLKWEVTQFASGIYRFKRVASDYSNPQKDRKVRSIPEIVVNQTPEYVWALRAAIFSMIMFSVIYWPHLITERSP